MWKRRLSHLHVLRYSTSWIPQIPTSYKALNYETRSLFPNKIHPPATTACSIVARKLITECNELLFSFPPTQLSLRPRNEIDECSRMLESRKAHSVENYCRGLIFAPFAPGGKISKSIPLWNVLRARVELIIGSSPELASVEGNKRRKRSTDLWPLSNERRTSPPPSPPPLSSPPPLERFSFRRFIGWRRIDRLRDPIIINLPLVRLFCLPRYLAWRFHSFARLLVWNGIVKGLEDSDCK